MRYDKQNIEIWYHDKIKSNNSIEDKFIEQTIDLREQKIENNSNKIDEIQSKPRGGLDEEISIIRNLGY